MVEWYVAVMSMTKQQACLDAKTILCSVQDIYWAVDPGLESR